ncbi:type III toxin-antitoxin system ToxN/AbiQ family toxin [Vibrio fluvialis]|nr:type III toxin-antitoxin system ToxN/AbiQ family toxin [Vibrio fluvialis]EKO3524367.1 type III toxin-antitoxin system ToxN/AbiQ family toxin [Vibrio fluvialis]EKO3528612.1 type III toxin-antitoxin system ToxN/AbiQ family toxin [Vibrio fluvialis]
MKIYTVSNEYLTHLRSVETKVPSSSYANPKPYVGVVLEVGGMRYLAPLTSPKFSVDKFDDNNPTLFKLHAVDDKEDKLGAMRLLYMIPVLESEITELDLTIESTDSRQDKNYKRMVNKQILFIRKNSEPIKKRAERLYHLAHSQDNFKRICCDFKALEAVMATFSSSVSQDS